MMKTAFLLAALEAVTLCGADAAPIEVTNKMPQVFVVTNKMTACFNCTVCGDKCQCFGGGYYCADGACPIQFKAAPAPIIVPIVPRGQLIGIDRFGRQVWRVCDGNSCHLETR